jgi:O-antigen ligase
LWLFGLVLCAAALVLSESRGGALAGLIGVMVFLIGYQWRSGTRSRVAVIVAAALLVLAVLGTAAGLMDRIFNITDPHGRMAIYPRVLDAIADRPVLGHGLGSFYDVFRAYVPQMSSFDEWDLAHSSYLENIFEMGVPVAALFYLALALLGFRLVRGVVRRQRDRTIVAFALGCFVIGAVHSIYDFSLQMPGLAAVFAWILGLGYAQSLTETELLGPSTPFAEPRRRRRKRRKLLRENVTPD